MTDPRSLRRELRARRERLAPAEKIAAAIAVSTQLLRLPELKSARHVAGYWAMRGELPLLGLVTALPASAAYCLPVLHGDTLRFGPWRPGEAIQANRFGIPEPQARTPALEPCELDVVLLPLVGFTRAGDRLGMGGGWYDRSFAFRKAAPAPPLLVGVGFACQEIPQPWSPRDWDVPLDAIATERELMRV